MMTLYFREWDGLDELVHLVPHLGGGQIVVGGHGGLAGGPGDTAELVLVSSGVEQEAHPSGQVRLRHGGGGLARPPSHSSTTDQAEDHDGNLEGDEDDEVGEVEGEDLAAGGGSGNDLQGGLEERNFLCS